MVNNVTQAEMAVGSTNNEDQQDYVVIVLANGGVEAVFGPKPVRECQQEVARLQNETFNTLMPKFFIRPLLN